MTTSIWWIRRDMRLEDNRALQSAAATGSVVPLFVIDPTFASTSEARRAYMFATLHSLNEATGCPSNKSLFLWTSFKSKR